MKQVSRGTRKNEGEFRLHCGQSPFLAFYDRMHAEQPGRRACEVRIAHLYDISSISLSHQCIGRPESDLARELSES